MNGIGPWWFPAKGRAVLTWAGGWFFSEASWAKHDASYEAGHPARAVCDRGFLAAMLRDASKARPVAKMAACCVLAWTLWALVRLFGWASYGRRSN